MSKPAHNILLLTAHLLLAGWLPGTYLWMLQQGVGLRQFYLAAAGAGLALLLLIEQVGRLLLLHVSFPLWQIQ